MFKESVLNTAPFNYFKMLLLRTTKSSLCSFIYLSYVSGTHTWVRIPKELPERSEIENKQWESYGCKELVLVCRTFEMTDSIGECGFGLSSIHSPCSGKSTCSSCGESLPAHSQLRDLGCRDGHRPPSGQSAHLFSLVTVNGTGMGL